MARALWAMFALPASLAHELTHVLASVPWARRVGLIVEPRSGRAAARIEWSESAGDRARSIAAIAPMLAGIAAAVILIALWIASGGNLPSSSSSLAKVSILLSWWIIYMTPSGGDAQVFWDGSTEETTS